MITAAVLRLLPRPRERQTAWLAVPSPEAAVELLGLLRERLGETVSSFELLTGDCVELVLRYLPGARAPLARTAPWYVLAEVAWSLDRRTWRRRWSGVLDEAIAPRPDRGSA